MDSNLDNAPSLDFELSTAFELSKTIQEPILNIHDAMKKIDCENPTIEDMAMYYASFIKVQKETKENQRKQSCCRRSTIKFKW